MADFDKKHSQTDDCNNSILKERISDQALENLIEEVGGDPDFLMIKSIIDELEKEKRKKKIKS